MQLTVIEIQPAGAEAVSVVDTDCEVDFDVPADVSSETGAATHLGGTELEVQALTLGAEPVARCVRVSSLFSALCASLHRAPILPFSLARIVFFRDVTAESYTSFKVEVPLELRGSLAISLTVSDLCVLPVRNQMAAFEVLHSCRVAHRRL